MKFDPAFFIDLGLQSGIAFERHGDAVRYMAKDDISAKVGKLFVSAARANVNDLRDYLPDLDEPYFQLDMFRNL